MNKPTLITITILTLLSLSVWFYNSNYGIGRYQLNDDSTMIDTKTGTVYQFKANEYNKLYFDEFGQINGVKRDYIIEK